MQVTDLTQQITGDVILPDSPDYDQVRNSFMRAGSPAIVVRPKNTSDVAHTIKYARANSLVLSVRSGGHSGGGQSTNNGGLVIDLAHLNTIQIVDKAKGIVKIGGGAVWGDIAKELQKMVWQYHRATPAA